MEKIVLAKVGDIEVTKDDMLRILRNMPQQQQQQVAGVEGRKMLLDEMVAGELFYLNALETNMNEDEKYLTMVEEAKRTILQQFAVQKLLEEINVTEDDVKTYYEANKATYVSGASATAKHILMADEDEIVKVKASIEAGEKTFEEAAGEFSTCPSGQRGGDLGAFERGRMVPEFEDVAFTQEIGVVSEPVKTQFGYHLILVSERSDSTPKSFEEVSGQIQQEMTMQKQMEIYQGKVADLKGKYPVELFEDNLA